MPLAAGGRAVRAGCPIPVKCTISGKAAQDGFAKRSGAAVIGPDERAQYAAWVESHERELHGSHHVGELSPFWSRLSVTALKLAVLLQLAHDESLTVSAEAMRRAITLTEFLKASLRFLFAEEFAYCVVVRSIFHR
jgi:hypothetical protein